MLIPQDPLLHGALGACARQEDGEDGSGRLEAAAAAITMCLEMRAGAMLKRESKLAKLYPPWADMTRGIVMVDTSSRWARASGTRTWRDGRAKSLCCRKPTSLLVAASMKPLRYAACLKPSGRVH